LFLLGLFAVQTSFAGDNVPITPKAREHFKAGVAYVEDPAGPKYEEAYREFHIAYAESPTYRILTNIGLCALNLERDGEAIESYEKFLANAKPEDIPKDKRTLMERDIAMLKASLVQVMLTATPANVTLRDERLPTKGSSVTNRYELTSGALLLGIHPGHHRVTASAEGFEPQTWDFEAESNTNHTHAFALKPVVNEATAPAPHLAEKAPIAVTAPPETKKISNYTLVYVGAAATGVFAVTATVFGLVEHSKKSDYDALNRAGTDPYNASDMRDTLKRYALVTDVSIGAALVSAGATAVFYFTSSSSQPEPKLSSAHLRFEPTIARSQGGVSLSGQF